MAKSQELRVQEEQNVTQDTETAARLPYFVPETDIFENDEAVTMILEIPGVTKDTLSVDLEDDQLRVEGRIDISNYEGLEPFYMEYDVGHYQRTFTLSNWIDRDKISADLKDGVLTLVLPKVEAAKPRKITVH
jgi:HSP20 family protein